MGKAGDISKAERRLARRRLSREEAELWRHVTLSVRPLNGREMPAPELPGEPAPENGAKGPGPAAKRTGKPAAPPLPIPIPPPLPPSLPELSHGAVAGIDKRTAQRLRRGKLPVEARIDLHGLTQQEAFRALAAFLAGAQRAGRRCVLVVTGKGLRPDGRVGVLRENVPRWLNQEPNRGRVLAFNHASVKDGGEGALYVLLRRAK